MNIVNKLTLRHLKENKGRSLITTLGIIVSVAMITAVFVAVASFLNLEGDIAYMQMGHKEAVFDVDAEQLEKLKNDDRLRAVGVESKLFPPSFQLEQKTSVRTGTGEIYCGDPVNLKQMVVGDYDGELPKNSREIAVEQELIDRNKLDWKIGDTVSIPTGVRYVVEDDERMEVKGSYFNGEEEFSFEDIGEYKITAILKENPATSQYSILRGLDMSELKLADGELVSATVNLKTVNYKSVDVIKDIVKDYNINDWSKNSEYLAAKLAIDPNSSVFSLLPIVLVILVIIMIASVVLIYNSFAMSINERVRYLGMLASVGATKAQKKMSAYYEGIILGAIGIPVGILSGVAGIGITLKAVGGKIISTGMLAGVSDNMSFDVVVPVWAIAGIILFSVLTIFISSFIPSRKASSVTPIDAIRQRQEIKVKAKSLKSPKIIRAIFGYEGELANKNLKRNGRKARVITASIALSVILFLCCNYFCSVFIQATDFSVNVPYQVQVNVGEKYYDSFVSELKKLNHADKYYSINSSNLYITSDKKDDPFISRSISDAICKKENLTGKYGDLFNSKKCFIVNAVDDEDFNALCQNKNIDYKKFYDGSAKLLLMNNTNHKENTSKVFSDKIIGTHFDIFDNRDEGNLKSDIEIAEFVDYDKDNYLLNLNPPGMISGYIPMSVYRNVVYTDVYSNDFIYSLGIETEQHEQLTEDLNTVFDANDLGNTYIVDIVDQHQMMNTIVFVMQVFIYGFIALITLITLFNIINTISNSTMLRKKEFAMFKSVGITPSGFNKMIVLESAFYGIKALAVALPISAVMSFAINKLLGEEMIPFEINWLMYLAVIGAVFVIVGMTMIYSVHKIKNDSIVETLKEEIN